MDNNIRKIVEECRVKEKKEELIKNRQTMFELDRLMAKLTFNREVAMYAFNIDKYYLLEQDEKKNKKEMEIIASKLLELEKLDRVLEYKKVREQFEILGYFKDEYYKSVNINLRRELSRLELPNIYIEQSEFDYDKHIIDKSPLEKEYEKKDLIMVCPVYDMKSIRDFRHFYNKTSFHYLEQLSEDCSFDVENKSLGKILIKKY